jgi:hypothetical protein
MRINPQFWGMCNCVGDRGVAGIVRYFSFSSCSPSYWGRYSVTRLQLVGKVPDAKGVAEGFGAECAEASPPDSTQPSSEYGICC